MAKRPSKARRPSKAKPPSRIEHPKPSEYPLLADFFRGYLHQDFAQEHASPADALAAYRGDLGPAEKRRLTREAAAFRQATRPLTGRRLRRLLAEDFGSAWRPPSWAALLALLKTA